MQLIAALRFPVRARRDFGPVFMAFLPTLLGVAGGCATSAFDLVQPRELSRHIGGGSDTLLEAGPLTYRFRAVEDHLVIRIYNPGDQPVTLLPGSDVVDPQGRSHPLAAQVIGPGAFTKLILPPMPPDQTPVGPLISFEITSSGRMTDANQPKLDSPVAPPRAPQTWSWPEGEEVRVNFRYRRGSQEPFTHSFSFRRRKM
jgi:hypothetical protein